MTPEKSTCPTCGKNFCDSTCNSNSTKENLSDDKKLKALIPSCNLDEAQLIDRKAKLMSKKSLFQKVNNIIELKDGYDLVFVQPKDFSYQLLEFINFERGCCSNFYFALEFEPHEKATHLKIFGSKAIKQELESGFRELGVIQ